MTYTMTQRLAAAIDAMSAAERAQIIRIADETEFEDASLRRLFSGLKAEMLSASNRALKDAADVAAIWNETVAEDPRYEAPAPPSQYGIGPAMWIDVDELGHVHEIDSPEDDT